MKKLNAWAAVAFCTALAGASQAAPGPLQGRDIQGRAVAADAATAVFEYDPNLDITWLRDWNLNGAMSWNAAMAWASSLTVGGFGGWTLPSARNTDGSGPCTGYGCSGSPMGYLYYTELGNVAPPAAGSGMTHPGPFQNVQPYYYWLGTAYAPNPNFAAAFLTSDGSQYDSNGLSAASFAVAVRAGDLPSPVPEPQGWAMLLAGMVMVAVARRKRAP